MLIARAAALACLATALVAQTSNYRSQLAECVAAENYACAVNTLVDHGIENGYPPVVVSVEGGPTVFGLQLFVAVNNALKTTVPTAQVALSERASAYAFDAHPDLPYAAGPFLLLNGEACVANEDRRCAIAAAQGLEFTLDSEQWYLPSIGDGEGENDIRARAEQFVTEILGG